MAQFTAATIPQQDSMLGHSIEARALAGELSRLLARLAAHQIAWNSAHSPMFTALDAGLLIPDIAGVLPAAHVGKLCGLSGAQPITREDVIALHNVFAVLLAAHDTTVANALYVKMVGAMNSVAG